MSYSRQIKMLDIAAAYGISSLKQLSLFLLFIDYEGCDLEEAVGYQAGDPEFKAYMSVLTKLMRGSKYRQYDGLRLLTYGDNTQGKQKQVLLTGKGRELAEEIKAVL